MTKDPIFHNTSSKTSGNDPVEGVDPGGTRSTHPGQRDKTAPKTGDAAVEQTVKSGDRNPRLESQGPRPK
ncbi:hypothetical protein [Rhodopila sp.]|uniref:hypothetical protein n=1 Tax=Rhodopila sp. TaxID=2480087 RepID=UPI003D0D0F5D